MGAVITHGAALKKKESTEGGTSSTEIIPVEGDYEFPAYSTVKAAVEYAQSLGVHSDYWPIYYGISDADIDIEELYARCQQLRTSLSGLSDEELAGHYLLKRIATWLFAGQRFCVTE